MLSFDPRDFLSLNDIYSSGMKDEVTSPRAKIERLAMLG